jgi:hypothetical protein
LLTPKGIIAARCNNNNKLHGLTNKTFNNISSPFKWHDLGHQAHEQDVTLFGWDRLAGLYTCPGIKSRHPAYFLLLNQFWKKRKSYAGCLDFGHFVLGGVYRKKEIKLIELNISIACAVSVLSL